jgi:hypothetical protein
MKKASVSSTEAFYFSETTITKKRPWFLMETGPFTVEEGWASF